MSTTPITQAGLPPFIRGPYASMYLGRPWTIRQYAGYSTAEESNAFYKKNLAAGQKGLSVAFDLPTHRGYDSDNEMVKGDIGKAGVAIDSVEDMKLLFQDIPLDKMSVSMTMNGAVIPILAFYIVAAQEQGVGLELLKGTIQNDILKEFLVRNTYIYPPEPSLRIIADIMGYCKDYMPQFNSISVSGYHLHEAGAPASLEIGYAIANGLTYLKTAIESGLDIDEFAPRISFFWGIGMDCITEIAKLRAARWLWAESLAQFNPRKTHSLRLRTHSQTSGWSLTAQQPLNNITRTTIEALAAVWGGTQSLHTNSYDEALALPSDYSAKIARDTQLYLQKHSKVTAAIDPWSGSNIVEDRTRQLYQEAKNHIAEIEKSGGMIQAIKSGIAKAKIEQAAALRQAQIENKTFPIIGLNMMVTDNHQSETVRSIDHHMVYEVQTQRLQDLKNSRDSKKVNETLSALKSACSNPGNNILTYAVEAARARATLGEISLCMEEIFGRYKGQSFHVSNIYGPTMKDNTDYITARKMVESFEQKQGRRPRILVVKLGQDGHDRGSKIIASSFSDLGFDVDLGPLFQNPKQAARQAVENDVHFIGISSLAGGHNALVPETITALKDLDSTDIKVILGGIVPEQDHQALIEQGVYLIFGPGTNIAKAVQKILQPYLD
ncbi:methylmalonyl-CoA mutase [Membranihabitans marinus]|uniref:methylmalonyl-CoA mutase n=1 Tax=Membranihabitans marinus TaxID=1227546 RepID=UPI001F016E2F|nr:methylmalonyl-CoA mutase [Membranihabitans marinus]